MAYDITMRVCLSICIVFRLVYYEIQKKNLTLQNKVLTK
jgi:hypothetical protein